MADTTAPYGTLAGTPVFSATALTNPYGLTNAGFGSNPTLADIDSDGDLDVFIGRYGGNTLFYRNIGSATSPSFAAPENNPFGLRSVGGVAAPGFADIDGDGDLDAFIGDYEGNTRVFLNTGSAASPVFAAPLVNPYGLPDVGYYASPTFADIDGDGDLDAFIGERDGNTLVSLNTGSATSPGFDAPVTNAYGLASAGSWASPSLVDIDSDGDTDVVIGGYFYSLPAFLNTGTATSPAFAAPVTGLYGLPSNRVAATPAFADIDGDGDLDVFVGDDDGNTRLYLNNGSFVAPVTSGTANGIYGAGSVLTLHVAFSENVIVDTSGGTPRLSLETGATDRFATYSGGSGTRVLAFSYTVQAGDHSPDLDFTSASALTLNGGTIRDAAGNNAILTLAAPGGTGSLAANAALVIDNGIAPTATLTSAVIPNTGSVTVQSTETGTAYLVNTSVAVSDLASITGAADSSWNQVTITAADTNTTLSAAGLGDGSYRLYTVDPAGDLSAASAASVTIDSTAPTATLPPGTIPSTGSVAVQSTETGNAYLVHSSVRVTDLASITGAPDASWNQVAITAADTGTALAVTGLNDGNYRLYTTDAAGNVSAASSGAVKIDNVAPHGALVGTPAFSAPVANPYGLTDVGDLASPCFADIDGDGDLDAFVGDVNGNTRLYLNTGSAVNPAFAAPVTNPYGLTRFFFTHSANPSFVDIDGDGDLDAFVGTDDAVTRLYLNTGSATHPAFAAPVADPFGLIDAGANASPSFADIDGDGDPDAFIGKSNGETLLYLNIGGATSPIFAAPVANPYGLTRVSAHARPEFADIDGDGDLDAFIGDFYDGNTLFQENIGSSSDPVFDTPAVSPHGLTSVGWYAFAKPSLADIDGDGDLDAFIGERYGNTVFFLNAGNFAAPVTSGTADGLHGKGSVITLHIAFSEAVIVDTTGGTPTLGMETGATDRVAFYSGGSGTDTLAFTYTVQAGDISADLDITGPSALLLNGGTIRDLAGNDAIVTLAASGGRGSLAANAALVIDGIAPTATLTEATLTTAPTGPVTAQSTETGTAYLVHSSVTVTGVSGITGADDAHWNSVAITAAGTDTTLATTGLAEGSYKLYTSDAAGNLSAASTGSVRIDVTPPTATLTTAALPNTSTATVQSSEAGTAYLVSTFVAVTDLASITSAADSSWNEVAITAADTETALAAAGLADGTYRLYTTDAAGHLSAASSGVVTIDSTAARGTVNGTPAFSAPVTSPYGLADIGQNAYPELADIDGDGDLDVFVGTATGQVMFFRNTGSATSPVFAPAVTNAFGLGPGGSLANLTLADIDGDGDLDAFTGTVVGNLTFFRNNGSATAPSFSNAGLNPFGLANDGFHSAPDFADIDGDGDLDAFVGNQAGQIMFYLNTGDAAHPAFAAAVANPFGLTATNGYPSPDFADIDGDGDLDSLIVVSMGDVQVQINTGTVTNPDFAPPVVRPYGLQSTGSLRGSISVGDIDGDGDLDLLVGVAGGDSLLFLNTSARVAPVTSATAGGTYGNGSVITLHVTFSESVFVDTSGGAPTLRLETGTIDRLATYAGGSGTSTLIFTYTVQAGDSSADLDIAGAAALQLNGGTIRDAAGNDALLALAAPGAPGSLAANAALAISGNDDTLTGTPGSDTLDGGIGADTMTGGAGNDVYYVDNPGDVVVELPGGGTDNVYTALPSYTLAANVERGSINTSGAANLTGNALDNIFYAGAGNNVFDGAAGNDMVSYASASSAITVDLSVSGAQNTGGSGNDTFLSIENLFGSNHNDVLTGNAAANNLQGREGADTIDGSLGADTMTGGDGNDRYYVDDIGDRVVEAAGGGADNVYSSLAAYTLAAHVERGTIHTASAADLAGNALDNILHAGTGNNVLDGAGGTDLVSYASASSGVTVSLAAGGAQSTGGSGTDTLVSIENLFGSAYDDVLTGDGAANNLNGGAGSGADTLDGGLGADTMTGGDGNDRYYVDDAADVVVELANGGADNVYSSLASYTLGANVERGTVDTAAAADLTGNALNNILYAGAGDNVLDGDSGTDMVSYASASAGVTVRLAIAGAQATGGSGSDTLVSIENLYGSAFNDRLTGDANANGLTGGAGADTLDGGLGADTLTGGSGNDRYHVDNASDQVVELLGDGTDTVYSTLASYTLGANVERGVVNTGTGGALTGNALNNGLTGGAGADTLQGLGGNDTLAGGAGADTFVFGALSGQDVIQDFQGGDGDVISLLSNVNGSGIVDAATALANMSDVAGNAVLDLSLGYTITLFGMQTADFNASHFHFH